MTEDNVTVPSANGDNGRQTDGRFAAGNRGGPGNPHAAAVGTWRAALVDCVTADDLRAVVAALVNHAKAGAPWAVRELLDRCLGKPKLPLEDVANADPVRILVEHVQQPDTFTFKIGPANITKPHGPADDSAPPALEAEHE